MKLHLFAVFLISACITVSLGGCTRPKVQTTLEVIPIDISLVKEDLTLRELKKMNGGQLRINGFVDYNGTDMPWDILGTFSTKKVFTAEDAVYALLSVRSFMRIGDASFACTEIEGSDKTRRFQIQQVYKGIAVEDGRFEIAATKEEGNLIGVAGFYRQVPDMDVDPEISMKKARKAFKLKWSTKITKSQLVIYGTPELSDCLAWKFIVSGRNPKDDKLVYIDAITGNIIAEYYTSMS